MWSSGGAVAQFVKKSSKNVVFGFYANIFDMFFFCLNLLNFSTFEDLWSES